MLKKDENGFSALIIILVLVILGVVSFAVYRMSGTEDKKPQQTNSDVTKNPIKEPEKDIEIQNFGLKSLDSVDITSNVLREFESNGHKGFYVFGDKLPGNRSNPNFEFASLKEGTKIISAIDGIVAHIEKQNDVAGEDYEVFLKTSESSTWVIGYDHIVDLNVKKGDKIKAGDVIGSPARQNNGALRFEFQINNDKSATDSTHVCPSTLLAPGIKDSVLDELKTMLTNWESQTGVELYNIESQNPVGCIKPTLTPAEAQGRL